MPTNSTISKNPKSRLSILLLISAIGLCPVLSGCGTVKVSDRHEIGNDTTDKRPGGF